MRQEYATGVASLFPALSIARTRRVCVPSPTVIVKGELHFL